jgi:Neuraminidase (sialidase)
MDELKIVSQFTKSIISKIIRSFITKKIGGDIGISIQDINVSIDDDKAKIHIDVDAEIDKNELKKIIKNIGLI